MMKMPRRQSTKRINFKTMPTLCMTATTTQLHLVLIVMVISILGEHTTTAAGFNRIYTVVLCNNDAANHHHRQRRSAHNRNPCVSTTNKTTMTMPLVWVDGWPPSSPSITSSDVNNAFALLKDINVSRNMLCYAMI